MLKYFVLSAIALLIGSDAYANCNNLIVGSSCWVSAQSDTSGSKVCDANGGCTCADYGGVLKASAPCWTNWYEVGYAQNGKLCCVNGNAAPASEERVEKSGTLADLSEVFNPQLTSSYFGYVNSTNRTGNYGRTTSAKARLDICLGGADTDSALAGGTASYCYTYCGTTNYNDYCTTNGAAVCNDRCECALGDPNCNNL